METEYMERVKSIHSLFKDKHNLENFKAMLDSLPNEKKVNFVNACLLYQQALKCKECKPTGPNIAMLLLCICADAIKITGKRAPRENLIRFYQTYCPPELKKDILIERYNPQGEPEYTKASFEEALHLIYERFRNPFAHEARRWFEDFSPELCESLKKWAKMGMQINIINRGRIEAFEKDSKTAMRYGDKGYHIIDIDNLLEWFKKATLESLNKFLIENSSKRSSKPTTE